MSDITKDLQESVQQAITDKTPLHIMGNNSKSFLGRSITAKPLKISQHQGIIQYIPTELVITARAGTQLQEIEQNLAEYKQMLPFEPPKFGENATLGGTIAANLSGPRRMFTGALRDALLGIKMLNGKGEVVNFGGQVMKNVAGFDLFRLQAGAMGTLGVILEASFKLLPQPTHEITLALDYPISKALSIIPELMQKPYPLSAITYIEEKLYIRLSGAEAAIKAAQQTIGGEVVASAADFWFSIKEHSHAFFKSNQPLWRFACHFNTPIIDMPGLWLYDWAGTQRWYYPAADITPEQIWQQAQQIEGHAYCFRHNHLLKEIYQPLSIPVLNMHQQLKQAFDPENIFNPGKLYSNW